MPITFFVRKIRPVHIAEPGLMAVGRQVAVRQNTGEFGNLFKNYCTSKDSAFCFI